MGKRKPRAYIGTSGWNYKSWKDDFFSGVPRKDWLRHCAERFTGIEVNATFYRTLKGQTYERWREQTPADFRFAVKGHRIVTHSKRLRDAGESIDIQRRTLEPLGDRLAVVLWQTPANFSKDIERLQQFLEDLKRWSGVRHVLEFRNKSWFDEETCTCLDHHGVGIAISDASKWPMWTEVTAGLAYVRLHGHTRTYASAYAKQSIQSWAKKARRWMDDGCDVHVYFDNDSEGAAPNDAGRLLTELGVSRDR